MLSVDSPNANLANFCVFIAALAKESNCCGVKSFILALWLLLITLPTLAKIALAIFKQAKSNFLDSIENSFSL